MNITSAQYVNGPSSNTPSCIKATIDGAEWLVPFDPANTHYAEVMHQVEAGELTIEAADEQPTEGA